MYKLSLPIQEFLFGKHSEVKFILSFSKFQKSTDLHNFMSSAIIFQIEEWNQYSQMVDILNEGLR